MFAALGMGVACGVQSYEAAVLGAGAFSFAAFILARSGFGHRGRYDGLVRFQVPSGSSSSEQVSAVMRQIPRTFALVTLRDVSQGEVVDHAYQVGLGGEGRRMELLEALGRIEGLRGLTFMNQETTLEV